MPVAERQAIRRPQRRAAEWIPLVCEQFSQATGWRLRFVSERLRLDQPGEVEFFGSPCWTSEVRGAQGIVGNLVLDLPESEFEDRSFAAVCELAELFGEMIARNLSLERSLEARMNELSVLAQLGLVVPEEAALQTTLKQLLRVALQLTGFRSAVFFLLEPRTDELRLRVAHHLEPREVPCPIRSLKQAPPDLEALLEGQASVLSRGPYGQPEWLPHDVSFGLCLPVQTASGPLGTLWLFDRRMRPHANCELPVLQALCAQLALILERVVLQRESATQKRVQQDLRTLADARRVQAPLQSMKHGGVEIAWMSSSRYEIGGDLCATKRISERQLAVMIGDATGDGLTAAMTMTAAHGAIEAILSNGPSNVPRMNSVLTQVGHAVARTCRLQHFMSLLLGTIDCQDLTVTYCNAGHPSPLLIRGDDVQFLENRGILLGVTDDAEYSESICKLLPRDILVFFSDGISEARNRQREFFGTHGVIDAARSVTQFAATRIVKQIWSRLESFAAAGEADDRSLMCVVVGE